MMDTLFWVGIGLFIGWNVPQPAYAKVFQAWIVNKFNNFRNS